MSEKLVKAVAVGSGLGFGLTLVLALALLIGGLALQRDIAVPSTMNLQIAGDGAFSLELGPGLVVVMAVISVGVAALVLLAQRNQGSR